MKKILLIKTSALGDIVQTYDLVVYLKALYPLVQIDWIVEKRCYEAVAAHPYIERAIQVDIKGWRKRLFNSQTWSEIKNFIKTIRQVRYDLVLDLQGNAKSALLLIFSKAFIKVGFAYRCCSEILTLLAPARRYNVDLKQPMRTQYIQLFQMGAGVKEKASIVHPPLKLDSSLATPIDDFVRSFTGHPLVLLCPGTIWENKKMSLKAWENFTDEMTKNTKATFLLLWDKEQDRQDYRSLLISKRVQFLPWRLNIAPLQYLMSKMEAVFSMDSFPLHLAATTQTMTFGLFGPSLLRVYNPQGPHSFGMQGECPYNLSFQRRCPRLRTCQTGACLKQLQGQQVAQAFLTNKPRILHPKS